MSDGNPTTEQDRDRWHAEIEQILSDIRIKNRQHQTEFWKVGVTLIIVTAAVTALISLTIPSPSGF